LFLSDVIDYQAGKATVPVCSVYTRESSIE